MPEGSSWSTIPEEQNVFPHSWFRIGSAAVRLATLTGLLSAAVVSLVLQPLSVQDSAGPLTMCTWIQDQDPAGPLTMCTWIQDQDAVSSMCTFSGSLMHRSNGSEVCSPTWFLAGGGKEKRPCQRDVEDCDQDAAQSSSSKKRIRCSPLSDENKAITVVFHGSFAPFHAGHRAGLMEAITFLLNRGINIAKVVVGFTLEDYILKKHEDMQFASVLLRGKIIRQFLLKEMLRQSKLQWTCAAIARHSV
eukprot:6480274-Amphidinium_carterae.3